MEDELPVIKIAPITEPPSQTPPGGLLITPAMQDVVLKTRRPTLFLAMVGLSLAVLHLLIGLGIAALGLYAVLTDYGSHVTALPYSTMVFGACMLALGCGIPSFVLLRYSQAAKQFAYEETARSFIDAIFAQRRFWRITGAATLVTSLLSVAWMLLSPISYGIWFQLN